MKTLIFGTLFTLSIAVFSPIASANSDNTNSTRYDEPIPGLPTSGAMARRRLEFAQKHNIGVLDLTPFANSNGQLTPQTSNPSNRSVPVLGTSGAQVRQQMDAAQQAPRNNAQGSR